jgi:hypothetical protein
MSEKPGNWEYLPCTYMSERHLYGSTQGECERWARKYYGHDPVVDTVIEQHLKLRGVPAMVRFGQVWGDNDPRSAGRFLLVEKITRDENGMNPKAVCRVLQDAYWVTPTVGKLTRISTKRFKATSTGFFLVKNSTLCDCGQPGELRVDPYLREIEGYSRLAATRIMCETCWDTRKDDI